MFFGSLALSRIGGGKSDIQKSARHPSLETNNYTYRVSLTDYLGQKSAFWSSPHCVRPYRPSTPS